MSLGLTALNATLSKIKLPHIRIAIPSLSRQRYTPVTITGANKPDQTLERQFREDYAALTELRARRPSAQITQFKPNCGTKGDRVSFSQAA